MYQDGPSSSKPVFSYMDGVPVKISENYKPPRKVFLPVGFQHRLQIDANSREYDFRLEKSVLQKMEEWRELRKENLKNRKDRLLAEDATASANKDAVKPLPLSACTDTSNIPGTSGTQFSSVSLSLSHSVSLDKTSEDSSRKDTFSNSPVCSPKSTLFPTTISCSPLSKTNNSPITVNSPSIIRSNHYALVDSILKPMPISNTRNISGSFKEPTNFNLSDFEADTSSPFDNVELKTINDMEELAHVLQPVIGSPEGEKGSGTCSSKILNNNNITLPYVNQTSVHYNAIHSKANKDVFFPHINGLAGYGPYKPENQLKDFQVLHSASYSSDVYNLPSVTMMHGVGDCFNYYPMWTMNRNVDSQYNTSIAKTTIETDQTLDKISYTSPISTYNSYKTLSHGQSFPSSSNSNSSSNQDQLALGRSLSKSVPDIVQELENELQEKQAEKNLAVSRNSYTPPPRPKSIGSNGLENWKPWPDLDSPQQHQTSRTENPSKELANLNSSGQELANRLSEMGFNLLSAIQVIQSLGEDETKVIEILLQAKALEEKGYPQQHIVKALFVNDSNFDETVKHLDALMQLMSLGFSEDKVSLALKSCNNDRDKALDNLIS